jgi:phosphatidylglycerol:prolipoprotein diacylglycerol transferase
MHLSYLQLGPLQIPISGIFAALGLMSALALSQRTARYANLSPEAVWNAGITAILSAFVISRLLLIAFNLRSFLQYPLLVLALPSLTTLGILITAVFMFGYIRWRRLPLLLLFDAAAPCAALLWAFLSLGRYFEGTRDGMTTHLPWGVRDSMSASIHPVEIYAFIAASLLCLLLLRLLQSRYVEAQTIAVALIYSGLVLFFLDFFRLPSDLLPNAFLDPSQIIGVAMILVGAPLFLRVRTRVTQESGTEPPHAV